MVTKAFAGLLSALLLSANGCLVMGCRSLTPKNQPESLSETLTAATAFAQANNLQLIGHVEITEPGFELYQGGRAAGVRGVLHFAANPAAPSKLDAGRTSDPALSASLPLDQVWLEEVASRMPVPKSWIAWSKSLHNQVIDLRKEVAGHRNLLAVLSAANAEQFQKAGPPSDAP